MSVYWGTLYLKMVHVSTYWGTLYLKIRACECVLGYFVFKDRYM